MAFGRSAFNAISLLALFTASVLLTVYSKPVQRGFWCDDQTIRYPYKPDTVSFVGLLLLSLIGPAIIVFLLENMNDTWHFWTLAFWKNYFRKTFVFFYGFLITYLMTGVCKYSIGRLRPNFMDVCRPEPYWNATVCTDFNDYITSYTCTGQVKFLNDQAHQSFFSGHSSFASFSMVYIVLVLHRCMTQKNWAAVRTTLQCAALTVAVWVGYTRINDNWHHPGDVAVGLVAGTLIAVFLEFTLNARADGKRRAQFASVNCDPEKHGHESE